MAVAPLQSASAGELRAAIQDNQFALFRAMARLPGGVLEEGERNNFHYSPPLNPFFKGIWGTNLPVEAVNQEIDRTLSWFRAREAPLIFWWTGPSTAPADLGQRLEKRGFVSMESIVPGLEDPHLGTPGMVADLGKLNATANVSAPDGLEVELVQDEASLHEFKQVLVDGYEAPGIHGVWLDGSDA